MTTRVRVRDHLPWWVVNLGKGQPSCTNLRMKRGRSPASTGLSRKTERIGRFGPQLRGFTYFNGVPSSCVWRSTQSNIRPAVPPTFN